MGNLLSKEDDKNKKKKKDDSDELPDVFPTSLIYYDEHGNLRLRTTGKRYNTEQEMRKIMEFDNIDEEVDGSKWYIIDSAWLNAWMAYTYVAQQVSPRPGPIDNTRLILWDEEAKEWVQRPGILLASKSWVGDYRRISEGAWKAFKEMYPGSGPDISCELSINTSEEPEFKNPKFRSNPLKSDSVENPTADTTADAKSADSKVDSAAPSEGDKKEEKKAFRTITKKEIKLGKWNIQFPPPEDPKDKKKKKTHKKEDNNKDKDKDKQPVEEQKTSEKPPAKDINKESSEENAPSDSLLHNNDVDSSNSLPKQKITFGGAGLLGSKLIQDKNRVASKTTKVTATAVNISNKPSTAVVMEGTKVESRPSDSVGERDSKFYNDVFFGDK